MNSSETSSRSHLSLTTALLSLLAVEKQRRKAIGEIESFLDHEDAKTAARCHQVAIHLLHQQIETAKEIQKLLAALADLAPEQADKREGGFAE